MRHVDGAISQGEVPGIGLEKLDACQPSNPRAGMGKDLRAQVAGEDMDSSATRVADQGGGKVARAGAHVEDRRLRHAIQEPLDPATACCDSARKAVQHRHLTQVLEQIRRVEDCPVEVLMGRVAHPERLDHT